MNQGGGEQVLHGNRPPGGAFPNEFPKLVGQLPPPPFAAPPYEQNIDYNVKPYHFLRPA